MHNVVLIKPRCARSFQAINLSTTREFNLIKGFASKAKVGGGALMFLDAGLRADKVADVYKAGGNWQKAAAVETAGFGFGSAAAIFAGSTAVCIGIGLALASTPLGWVVVIGAGLAAGYLGGQIGDALGKGAAKKAYDFSSSLSAL